MPNLYAISEMKNEIIKSIEKRIGGTGGGGGFLSTA
jgi:hypothetical protein